MTYELRWTRRGRLELMVGEAFVEEFDDYDQAAAFMIDANLPIPPCPPKRRAASEEPRES